jgi:hypothetical protein
MTGKFTLITNLDYVSVNGLRTNCSALLLEETDHSTNGLFNSMHGASGTIRRQIRGFGPDGAWPVFDLDVPSLEFAAEGVATNHVLMMSSDGERVKPLMSGARLQFKDGPEILLWAENDEYPIAVEVYPAGISITEVWPDVVRNAARYWKAPNMPLLQWVPAESVRTHLRAPRPPRPDRTLKSAPKPAEPAKLEESTSG